MPCQYYKWNGGVFGDYWCIKKDQRVPSDHYYRYCRDYNYNACSIYKETQSSGCFITTVVCDILGKEDNDSLLENFRNFRDNVLQQDEKYYDTLKEYDVIGPMLVDCIDHDKDKVKMAEGLYKNIMMPLNDKITNKEYDHAVSIYHCMTVSLVEYYGLSNDYEQIKSRDYDYPEFDVKLAGHGLRKIKIKTEV